MARDEHDREDLLREATALTERVEIAVDGFAEPVVAGFRASGAASFFLAADLVYQFNAAGELRRGYLGERLIKAERGGLASLTRLRTGGQVQLRRHDFDPDETASYLLRLATDLDKLQRQLESSAYRVIGQVPAETDVVARVLAWLQDRRRRPMIAGRPNA